MDYNLVMVVYHPSIKDHEPVGPSDALSYIYLMLQELAPMAREAEAFELARALESASEAAALALKELGQPDAP